MPVAPEDFDTIAALLRDVLTRSLFGSYVLEGRDPVDGRILRKLVTAASVAYSLSHPALAHDRTWTVQAVEYLGHALRGLVEDLADPELAQAMKIFSTVADADWMIGWELTSSHRPTPSAT